MALLLFRNKSKQRRNLHASAANAGKSIYFNLLANKQSNS